ncbi:cytochrome P450 CYP82D47-like [Vitis riparia]|uniref:cytochrome P450 CYP82D47-like n=1 Tax=Vitis riparia TaxID=96939 RepID=UPI00155A897D|nr:cytochrome P450 CYP82D47-like [Vitis riparia]
MGYDQAMFGFSPYGPYWRDVRKLTSVELLSNRQLELLNHVRDSEASLGLDEGEVLAPGSKCNGERGSWEILSTVTNDYESRRCQKALGDLLYLSGIFIVSDAIPFLGWLDTVRGYTAEMKRTVREVDQVLGSWVEEHRRKRFSGSMNEAEQDFNHVMLSVIEDGQFSDHDHDTVIKDTCLTLIIGGSDSTVITLTWALSLLMNNPSTLKRAQDELDIKVGKHRQVDESDIKNLVYLQSIIKETLITTVPCCTAFSAT